MSSARIEKAVRTVAALMLAVFGADKFLHVMPQPTPPEDGGKFLGALAETGYIFPLVGAVFVLAAVLLVSRRVALGLLLVAPIVVNILAYHLKYDLAGTGPGALLALLLVVVAFLNRGSLLSLVQPSLGQQA